MGSFEVRHCSNVIWAIAKLQLREEAAALQLCIDRLRQHDANLECAAARPAANVKPEILTKVIVKVFLLTSRQYGCGPMLYDYGNRSLSPMQLLL